MIDTKETTEGRRIEARSFADGQVDAVRRYWYNDQWQVLTQGYWSQAYASFTLSRNYLYGNTIDEVLGFEWVVNGTPSIWYYYLHDHLYSPAAMLTDYGVVERYEYDAYGRRSVMTPGFAHRSNSHYLSDIGLTGREIDELDLDAAATPRLQHMHYRHRDYSPQLGRFMQHDPLMHVDGMNFYQYVKSKPISQLDPLGLKTLRGKVELAPGKLMSFGYEYVYEYDDSCGDDGKTPSFTGKGVTYSNSLWQADTVAIGIIGGKFNVLVEISVTSGDCPPEQEGGVLNVDLTFKPVYQDGIVIGIGPIGVPIWTPKPRPAGFPEDNQRLQVVCCKKECD